MRRSFEEVVRLRQAELADRLVEIDAEAAIKNLMPLAENYLASDVFARVEAARKTSDGRTARPIGEAGLWSELSFRLRRPLGVLSGTIDKLVISPSPAGALDVEIIDFKTNRITVSRAHASTSSLGPQASRLPSAPSAQLTGQSRPPMTQGQFAFDFDVSPTPVSVIGPKPSMANALFLAAQDYQLQMQSYALAVRELVPSLAVSKIRVTLHFLEPNLEFHLDKEKLKPAACAHAIDEAMLQIISSSEPAQFPVNTAIHCRMCNFLPVCAPGRDWLRKR